MSDYSIIYEKKKLVDRFLDKKLPNKQNSVLTKSMRYSIFAGGKRLRPILSIFTNNMLGGDEDKVYFPACAIELIHTYSLIHDDLPALDNDDLRRGKASCHKQFGEAIALLAGDGLLTLAFNWIAKANVRQNIIVEILKEVSKASGIDGMVGGQVMDLEMTGGGNGHSNNNNNQKQHEDILLYIHKNKTASLIKASVIVGALCSSRVQQNELEKLELFGYNIGLAFQIVDDILDIEGKSATLGKTKGKDEKMEKLTYPSIYGIDASRTKANNLIKESKDILSYFKNNDNLSKLIDFLCTRTH